MTELPELKVMYGLRGPYIASVKADAISSDLTLSQADEIIHRCKAYEILENRNILLESVLCEHVGYHCEKEDHSPTLCDKCVANIKGLIRDKAKFEQVLAEIDNG